MSTHVMVSPAVSKLLDEADKLVTLGVSWGEAMSYVLGAGPYALDANPLESLPMYELESMVAPRHPGKRFKYKQLVNLARFEVEIAANRRAGAEKNAERLEARAKWWGDFFSSIKSDDDEDAEPGEQPRARAASTIYSPVQLPSGRPRGQGGLIFDWLAAHPAGGTSMQITADLVAGGFTCNQDPHKAIKWILDDWVKKGWMKK